MGAEGSGPYKRQERQERTAAAPGEGDHWLPGSPGAGGGGGQARAKSREQGGDGPPGRARGRSGRPGQGQDRAGGSRPRLTGVTG